MIKELFSSAKDIKEAISIKKAYEENHILPLKLKIASSSPEEKRVLGQQINALKGELDKAFYEFKNILESKDLEPPLFDLPLSNPSLESYSFNYLSKIQEDLIELFHGLGFTIERGREVVTVEENFDNLCIPENHPSRSKSETFYLDNFRILRPHCTSNTSIHLISKANRQDFIKCVTIGPVYRRDDESNRHTHQFTQLDFVCLGKGINLSNLKWMLKAICGCIFGESREYRFRNSYFPFTKPSLELDMKCICDDIDSCRICKGTGWIEILGAGMLRDEILRKAGYSEEFEAIAGGVGIERLALIKYQVKDIRSLYSNSFQFLKDDNF
ncbi:phenylalanyl-tRNA synthetase, alpha subunit [Mycoplasma haemofelis Ohio2]|uniref:Phenylalanyl-tRNA synthetase, alpha subunit n=1 Tax=Mycoplasma haemofelis (strain Ohio2) TaxID=859194 RepID=F6FHP8_MYCHI|nr:phenylalanyl-tRNA synthetase, alpha subunit [Mycoplasma haemofelis Ohio2]